MTASPSIAARSVDPAEIEKFSALAESWWDPEGQFKPLHRLNPHRIRYIRDQALRHFGREPGTEPPLAGLSLVDIGCGGGLIAEPMTRLGAAVTGIDAASRNVEIARRHAETMDLPIAYLAGTAEDLAASGKRYDIVLALEIVEHVADRDSFLATLGQLMKPQGMIFLATLNRTLKSFALAIIGAEYVLRWLPRGTHDWRKFLRPSELAAALRPLDLEIRDLTGIAYDPWRGEFFPTRDLDVNYMSVIARV